MQEMYNTIVSKQISKYICFCVPIHIYVIPNCSFLTHTHTHQVVDFCPRQNYLYPVWAQFLIMFLCRIICSKGENNPRKHLQDPKTTSVEEKKTNDELLHNPRTTIKEAPKFSLQLVMLQVPDISNSFLQWHFKPKHVLQLLYLP